MRKLLLFIIFIVVGGFSVMIIGRQSTDNKTRTSLMQLESALQEACKPAGFLWLDKEVSMFDLEGAMELSRRLPLSPKLAFELVRAFVEEHPEEGELRGRNLKSLTIKDRDPRISIFRHYYFFRSKSNFKFSYPRLVGFFVDAHSGEVIPYPGLGFSGDEDDSPFRVNVPYAHNPAGKLIIDPEDPFAQYFMGLSYQSGKDVPKSPEKAATYFRRAADQGDSSAQAEYADCCWEGFGVPVSREEALRYYHMAAEQAAKGKSANTKSVIKLAHLYAQGECVPQSWEQAVYWYEVGVYWDEPEAIFYLAECYEKGLGVSISRGKAVELYRKIIDDHRAKSSEEWKPWADMATEALRGLTPLNKGG